MGKKARMKEFRKIAKQLPGMTTTGLEKAYLSGETLIDNGVRTIGEGNNKAIVDPNGNYVQSTPVQIPVNHARRLKKQFARQGAAGMRDYVGYVQNVLEKHKAEAEAKSEELAKIAEDATPA